MRHDPRTGPAAPGRAATTRTSGRFAGVLVVAALALLTGFGFDADSGNRWSREERAILAAMRLAALPAPPADPSNAVADRPEAAALGKRLFADARLSGNGQVSCASCHTPEREFQDGLPVGKGVGTGSRRTMPIAATAHSPWLFWDGRKDSQWSQALGPLEDGVEHGGNRARFAHILQANYKREYEALFGPMPTLQGVPADASPLGNAEQQQAWARMSDEQRDAVNRMFANLGKSIAAYERKLGYGASRFDRYAQAVIDRDPAGLQAMTPQEVDGLRLFIGKAQCATCHNGPLLSDQHFHNTGVPARDPARPDRGRAAATAKVRADEFNCLGRYSDAPRQSCEELNFMAADDPALVGAFKTPSLRNVALRAPYMHAGQIATLAEVIAHYVRSPAAPVGHSELAHDGKDHAGRTPIRLTDQEMRDLLAFMHTLSGPIVERATK